MDAQLLIDAVTLLGVVGFIGASTASFLCLVADRLPEGRNITTARSECVCGHQLTFFENLPVAGWLRLRGVAACCGTTIPPRYLYAELALGGVFTALAALSLVGVPTGRLVLVGFGASAGLLTVVWRLSARDRTDGAALEPAS
jgi:prepilin signal peptidase PulO-like enzyme (type II secretory pathway)